MVRFRNYWWLILLVICFMALAEPSFSIEQQAAKGLKRGCLFAFYPDDNKIFFKIDFSLSSIQQKDAAQVGVAPMFPDAPPDSSLNVDDLKQAAETGRQCSSVDIRITEKGSTSTLFEMSLPVKDGISGETCLDNVKLRGVYEIHFTLNGLPEPLTLTKTLERKTFEWEGNQLGITDEIYPPFEPVKVKGRDVSVVLRRYTMNGFGLWDKVIAEGRDILAGPVTLRYTTSKGEGKWGKRTVTSDEKACSPQKAVFNSWAESGPVYVKTVSTIETDGCMKVEMDLMPGKNPEEITQLWVDIPLKDKEAPLFHEVSDYIRNNFSGFAPAGEGLIWDSSKSIRTGEWLNPFTAYIWMGAEECGLCWFAENDRGWITEKGDNAQPLQKIFRKGGKLTLRIYLVNKPVVIKETHSIVFGLQASPTKPMEKNWRAKTTSMPGGSGPVNPWGGLHCGYKGPYRGDWQIVDKIIEAQKTGVFDDAWFNAYVEKYNPPPAYGNWNWLESVRYFSSLKRRPVMTYQEELIQSVLQPEWLTFQDQWRNAGTLGTEMSLYTQRRWFTEDIFRVKNPVNNWSNPSMYVNYCPSYRDYGCWYANEWFKRGISAYWDNTFPKYTYNTRNSAAYMTADGKIQPAMVIWNEREYMKRVWNILQYWRKNQQEPLEWSHHITNALVLPFASWATVILNYELDSPNPFPPEKHRAEAVGRQVGAMPYWLFTPTGSQNKIIKNLMKTNPRANGRPDWGMKMAHEALRTEYTGGSSLYENERVGAPELERIVVGFGYTKPGTAVHNYWDESPVITSDNDQVKWIVLARPENKSLLLVLQSWSAVDTTVRIILNGKSLGFAPGASAFDAETNKPVNANAGILNIDLPGPYGTRLIKIQ